MPFVKLDCGFLQSSLWPDHCASRVFLAGLMMAMPQEFTEPIDELEPDGLKKTGFALPPGWYGFVEAAGPGIIGAARVTEEDGYAALKALASPDKRSRSDDFEGRRMVRVNGGYIILNYIRFREKDHTGAARQRRFREKKKQQPELIPRNAVTSRRNAVTLRYVTQAEAEAEADSLSLSARASQSADRPSWEEVWAYAQHIGFAAEWKVRHWFDEMESCGWLDRHKREIVKWQGLLATARTWWESDGRPLKPPSKNGTYQQNAPRNRGTANEGQASKYKLSELQKNRQHQAKPQSGG